VEGAWAVFKERYPGLDVEHILNNAHGVRTVENLRNYCGIEDDAIVEAEARRFEQAIVDTSRSADGEQGIVILPGARRVMDELSPGAHGPNACWAICTSATRTYASQALEITGIAVPSAFVVSEDVERGKPSPDPYLLGAQRLGVDPSKCIVFEDAPNGVLSGRAAGCKTVALLTTHSKAQIEITKPDFIIKNLDSIQATRTPSGVQLIINVVD